MRILHFTDSLKPGGVTTVIYDLAQLQTRRGHQVTIGVLDDTVSTAETPVVTGIKLVMEILRADVIQSHHRKAGLIAVVLRRHGTVDHVHNRYFGRPQVSFRANQIVAVSDEIAAITRSNYPHVSGRTTVIRNGTSDLVQGNSGPLRGGGSDSAHVLPMVTGVGRVAFQKQPLEFVKVVAELKTTGYQFKSQWIGDGDADLERDMDELILRCGLEDVISRVPWSSRIDTIERIRASSVCLITSAWEGLPLVGLEALSVGTPVVSTEIGDFSDCLSRYDENLVYRRAHSSEGAQAVARIVFDPEGACKHRHRAREIWKDNYRLSDRIDSWEAIYERARR